MVAARPLHHLERLANRIGGTAVRCDAGSEDDIKALAKAALETYVRLDIPVNSAGQPVMGEIAEMAQDMLDTAASVNLFGAHY
jgi:NAD(P)-dependent dehydrogenase (short-subunit alcohol dehydrogenase family)